MNHMFQWLFLGLLKQLGPQLLYSLTAQCLNYLTTEIKLSTTEIKLSHYMKFWTIVSMHIVYICNNEFDNLPCFLCEIAVDEWKYTVHRVDIH